MTPPTGHDPQGFIPKSPPPCPGPTGIPTLPKKLAKGTFFHLISTRLPINFPVIDGRCIESLARRLKEMRVRDRPMWIGLECLFVVVSLKLAYQKASVSGVNEREVS